MSQSTTMHGSKGIMDINRALNILFPHGIDEQSG